MADFTKGPWKAPFKNPTKVITEGGANICKVVREHKSLTETFANAHLIAASPDLYAALEEACQLLDELSNPNNRKADNTSSQVLWARCVEVSRKGQTIISKANGGKSNER